MKLHTATQFCATCNMTHAAISHFSIDLARDRLKKSLKACPGRISALWDNARSANQK